MYSMVVFPVLNILLSLFSLICLLLFKSVVGPWQGLQNPRGLPHRLHGYWSVHHHLHSRGFLSLSRQQEMSRKERRGGESEGMWTVGDLCICSVLAYCGHYFIKVLNKGLYYAVRRNGCDVLSLGINYTLWGHQMQQECKVHANVTQFYFTLVLVWCEQQLAAKIRRVLHVTCLCNLSNRAVTSNSLITFLCPSVLSHCVPPAHRLSAQECCVCVCRAAVYCRLSFIFYLLRAAAAQMHFLKSGKRGAEMWRGSPAVEAVYVNRLLTGSPPQASPPTEPHRSYAVQCE